MKPLNIIVPGNLEGMVAPESVDALERLGVNPGFLVYFTIYNWDDMAHGPEYARGQIGQEIYETLMEDWDEDELKPALELLYTSIDAFSYDANNIYRYLKPFVGDLFLGREDIEIVSYEQRPIAGGRDTLIHLDLESRDGT